MISKSMNDRKLAVDALIAIVKTFDIKIIIAGSAPIAYFFPRFFLILITFAFGFGFGLIFMEGLVDEEGGVGLIKKWYTKRTKHYEKISEDKITFEKPPISMEVGKELEEALHEFIGYVVRDFINGWYQKVNESESQEFPDAVHAAIFSAFLTLGSSIVKVNPTDLILSVMNAKEFREFDESGLDIQDFLIKRPTSKFAQYQTKQLLAIKLRDSTMRLAIKFLPRADRNSAAVFGITREILASKVFLPMFEKITNPIWLNETLLKALRKREDQNDNKEDENDSLEDTESESVAAQLNLEVPPSYLLEPINWARHMEHALEDFEMGIKIIKQEIEDDRGEQMENLLLEKIKIQGEIEEITDIISQERESALYSTLTLFPVYNANISFKPTVSDSESYLLSISKQFTQNVIYFMITVKTSDGVTWNVIKILKDFEDLIFKINTQLPRSAANVPKILKKRTIMFTDSRVFNDEQCELVNAWFNSLLKDPVFSILPELVKFLQPGQTATKIEDSSLSLKGVSNILNTATSFSVSKAYHTAVSSVDLALSSATTISDTVLKKAGSAMSLKIEKAESTEALNSGNLVSEEDMEIIMDIIFTAIEELFFLAESDQWVRQQSLHMIKTLLKRLFGTKISKAINTKLEVASSQESIASAITGVSYVMWPGGRRWGTNTPEEPKTAQENDRVKHQLFCLLTKQEGMVKNEDFGKAVTGIQNLVGKKNTRSGLLRGFHLIQNQQLNLGLCCEIMEEIATIVTNN